MSDTKGPISAEDLAAFHRVLESAAHLDDGDPQSVEVQRAVGHMFKLLKRERRKSARAKVKAADRDVLERTATGNAERIDDETAGILLSTPTAGDSAGELLRPQSCYICKQPYTRIDAFYHQLCPECAAFSHSKRDATTDLSGRRALLTGGRAKIGMYIALRLLRDGADLTITTRFPTDAARRFAALADSAEWLDRLHIVGIDLRDPSQVSAMADAVAARGPLDIIINNAAQTVRRSPGAYSALVDAEAGDVPPELAGRIIRFGRASSAHPAALTEALDGHTGGVSGDLAALDPAALTALALRGGSSSAARIEDGTAIDAGGLLPDLVHTNSWVQTVDEVEPLELLEVQLCNSVAPFILISKLRPALAASPARRKYVVNVSAMEGQFGRGYKGPGHPHTNMAKAALNMLTRTSSLEMLEQDGILMTAVDTGWITDERPHHTKMRLAEEGFRAPLDLVDGAARVYDPIVQGEAGVDLYGCFLKDYKPSPW
ncbi:MULTISPECIES: SDR family NAD(P)-dependent oxidoreductase [Tsukamurella]|uniref:SDR family NAD(P)-dependent oxidoreductase n=2 Tax=Tsukamurella TaxID=2060 RepID=A0A5C5S1S6_9ACTN|nr:MULTISPECIES: SDR family NAD(P)-dependent oxidoreductase [Tsukamurella]NMD54249.1 SDR family NAD(P)-dependent oxidoreductase [Tsukamurella columbiensis]TWS28231.1 SDR family NAD(P)-dependent oxidoreductase [Tsukamurella conjunctivitidis]